MHAAQNRNARSPPLDASLSTPIDPPTMATDANKFVVTPHADGLSRLTFSPDGQ